MGHGKSNMGKMIFTLAFLFSALMGLTAGLPYYPTGNSYRARTERMMKPTPTQTIAELAIATPQLSTLLAAVQAADLVETLSGEGPFTFAPTNEAFAEIPKDTLDALLADKEALTAVLLRHVVPGAAQASCNVPRGTTSLDTAGGES